MLLAAENDILSGNAQLHRPFCRMLRRVTRRRDGNGASVALRNRKKLFQSSRSALRRTDKRLARDGAHESLKRFWIVGAQ